MPDIFDQVSGDIFDQVSETAVSPGPEVKLSPYEEARMRAIERGQPLGPMGTFGPEDAGLTTALATDYDRATRLAGTGLTRAGQYLVGSLADVGEAKLRYPGLDLDRAMMLNEAVREPGEPPTNIDALTRGEEMPAVSQRKYLSPVPRAVLAGSQGLIESAPRMAAMAGLQAVGVPAWAAGGAAFGLTEEGLDPKAAAIGAALPAIGGITGGVVERLATRWGVTSEVAADILNRLGGTAGATGLLAADQIYELSKLPPEQREGAWVDAVGSISSMALLGAMGRHAPAAKDLAARQLARNVAGAESPPIEVASRLGGVPMVVSEGRATPGRGTTPFETMRRTVDETRALEAQIEAERQAALAAQQRGQQAAMDLERAAANRRVPVRIRTGEKPVVPETGTGYREIGPEPTPAPELASWEDFVGDLKQRGQPDMTIDQIRAMYPGMQMSRQAARSLAREAWGDAWGKKAEVPSATEEGNKPPSVQPERKGDDAGGAPPETGPGGGVPPPAPEPPQAPPTEKPPVAPKSDYERYQELRASIKGKSLDEAQAIMAEMEAIKNRNGGMPPKPPEAAPPQVLPKAGEPLLEVEPKADPQAQRKGIIRALEELEDENRAPREVAEERYDSLSKEIADTLGMDWGEVLEMDQGQLIKALHDKLGELEKGAIAGKPAEPPVQRKQADNAAQARMQRSFRDWDENPETARSEEQLLTQFNELTSAYGAEAFQPDLVKAANDFQNALEQNFNSGGKFDAGPARDAFVAGLAKLSGAEAPRPRLPRPAAPTPVPDETLSKQITDSYFGGEQPKKPFTHEGKSYVVSSIAWTGENGIARAWELVPASEWKGETFTKDELYKRWDANQGQRGDLTGMRATIKGKDYVLANSRGFQIRQPVSGTAAPTAAGHLPFVVENIQKVFKVTKSVATATYELARAMGLELDKILLAAPGSELSQEALFSVESYEKGNWIGNFDKAAKRAGWSDREVKSATDLIQGVVEIFKANADVLPNVGGKRPSGKPLKTLVKNADFKFTLDVNRICKRVKKYWETVGEIQDRVGRPLNENELLSLGQQMRADGDIPGCIFCYVEASRRAAARNADMFASKTLEELPQAREATVEVLTERDKLIKQLGWSLKDLGEFLIDREAVLKARDDGGPKGKLAGLFFKYVNSAKGTALTGNGTYRHDLLSLKPEVVADTNQRAGLRWLSATDLDPTQMVDVMQALADATVRGIAGHLYTKDPYTALILGDTGMKINLSIAMNWDGIKYVDDPVNGMPHSVALRLKEKYPNVGTMLVAKNLRQIEWGLNSKDIDMMIPHHAANWTGGAAKYGIFDLDDFSTVQHERWVDPKKAPKKWETVDGERKLVALSPKEAFGNKLWFSHWLREAKGNEQRAVKMYLKFCEDNGIKPKFSEGTYKSGETGMTERFPGYTDHPGYYKLLKDFARTDSKQTALDVSKVNISRLNEYLEKFIDRGGWQKEETPNPATVAAFMRKLKSGEPIDLENLAEVEKALREEPTPIRDLDTPKSLGISQWKIGRPPGPRPLDRLLQETLGVRNAAVDFIEDGKALIYALEKPNAASGAHELAHIARRNLMDRSLPLEKRLGISDTDIRIAEEWSGAKDGVWTREAEEKFARGFERYLRDGKAPTQGLAKVFATFREWLSKIYRKIAGSAIDLKISPEMRGVYNALVSRREAMEAKPEVKPEAPKPTEPPPAAPAAPAPEAPPAPTAAPAPAAAPPRPRLEPPKIPVSQDILARAMAMLDAEAAKAQARIEASRKKTTMGSGPLHELPNIRDYAIIAAALIAKHGLKSGRWASEMVKQFTERVRPHLDAIRIQAQDILADYQDRARAVATPVQQIIAEATGIEQGQIYNSISNVINTLQSRMKTVRALQQHFEGAPQISKAEVKVADDWLEADANQIKTALTDLAKQLLPVSERGRFITAINNASRRAPLLTGDPGAMYRRAAKVAASIENWSEEVTKRRYAVRIENLFKRAVSSPTVDIAYKARIEAMLESVLFRRMMPDTIRKLKSTKAFLDEAQARGENVDIPRAVLEHLELLNRVPLRDMPIEALAALHDKIALLETQGRTKLAGRQYMWEREKQQRLDELSTEKTTPFERRPLTQAPVGEPDIFLRKIRNALNKKLDAAALFDRALLPIDAVMDMLGDNLGTYKGWLFRKVRGPIDLAFNEAQVLRDIYADPISEMVKKHKMTSETAERINVYALSKMEGGVERMVAMGIEPEQINKILSSMTPQELEVYQAMRKAFDEMLPMLQSVMHELYNIDVKPVENYWPMPRDWSRMEYEPPEAKAPGFGEAMELDELANWKALLGDFIPPKTTRTERGFTRERKPGAATPIKMNAFDVFYQHVNDAAYLIKTQREIKMAGEMVRSDLFKQKYGELGQVFMTDWLDTVARQGRIGGFQRWRWLDSFRKKTAAGAVGFRVASNLVHLSNIPMAMQRTGGPMYWGMGLGAALSEKGQLFLKQHFAETFARGGGEPGIVEAANLESGPFEDYGGGEAMRKAVRASFVVARMVDRINSQATVMGIYMRELQKKGIDPQRYAEMPIDKEAITYALVAARRAVASPLPKDVPLALSRGAVTGGNISIGRSILQFQNIFLDQWSNLRHDLWRAGIREHLIGKGDPTYAAAMTLSIMSMLIAESMIRGTVKYGLESAIGYKPKEEEDINEKLAKEVIRRFPFGGQLTAAVLYGSSGVPTLDTIRNIAVEAHKAVTAKKPDAQYRANVRLGTGVAQALGVPGASQAGELIVKQADSD